MTDRLSFENTIDGYGFSVQLWRQPDAGNRHYAALNEGEHTYIYVPQRADISVPAVQILLKEILTKMLLMRAKEVLPKKMAEMEKMTGLKCNSLKFNKAASRWGSCSSKRDINLSCYLMLLPERHVEYIIVHELCHTKYMNHGADFKKLWRSWFYDYKILDIQMKEYGTKTWYLRKGSQTRSN